MKTGIRIALCLLFGLVPGSLPGFFQMRRPGETLHSALEWLSLPGSIGSALLTGDVRTNSFMFIAVGTLFYGLAALGVVALTGLIRGGKVSK